MGGLLILECTILDRLDGLLVGLGVSDLDCGLRRILLAGGAGGDAG